MRLAELQRRMQRAMLSGGYDAKLLAMLADPEAQRERRLAVHRDNVRHALLSVLEAAFPVVQQLVGAECFAATALAFIVARPPRQPALYRYGAALPDFINDFPPLRELPWLADVARLEWARNVALFADERESLTPNQLAMVPAAELPSLQLELHPAARIITSRWPIHAIWAAHQPNGEPLESVDLGCDETVLVWRCGGSVHQRTSSAGESALLAAFAMRQTLAEAAGRALAQDPGFDLSTALAALLISGLLIRSKPA